MKSITVWKTGHIIADTVAGAVHASLSGSILKSTSEVSQRAIDETEIHICYGILRGADTVFRLAEASRKPWFNIDKGYWKPGHYDGYYRISLRGTQQTTFHGLESDYAFIADNVDCVFRREMCDQGRKILVCPPTEYVAKFNNIYWLDNSKRLSDDKSLYREKGCLRPLQSDLDQCSKVITFNSSVGWEALRQGIEVISDPAHSIVGAYQKFIDKPLHLDFTECRKFFAILASLQLTLSEMREGQLWPLLQKLLGSTSDMTVGKLLPRTWQHIVSRAELTQKSTSNS